MRKTYIATIDNHLSEFHAKGENFGKEIDETISQLETVISNAQAEINQLQSFRNVVSRFTWPDYERPEPLMPKTAELEQKEPEQMQVTLDDDDDADLQAGIAGALEPESTDKTQQPT